MPAERGNPLVGASAWSYRRGVEPPPGEVIQGVGKVLATALVPVLLVGAGVHWRSLVEAGTRLGRAMGLLRPPVPAPGPSLARIAHDLRRLHPEARKPTPGVPMARYRGIVEAYDDALRAACVTLEVPHDLDRLSDGMEREAERLRLEFAIEEAGLRFLDSSR